MIDVGSVCAPRLAVAGDAPGIAALLDEARSDIGLRKTATIARLAQWAAKLPSEEHCGWVRTSGDRVVALITFYTSEHRPNEPEIFYLVVCPDFHRHGIALKLLVAAQRLALRRHWISLTARASPKNQAVQTLLHKAGFYDEPPEDGWLRFRWRAPVTPGRVR
jgi:GNAT superfamily N-acetyltransferase